MKRYETYKDSGVEWLGAIPEHWNVCRTKNIVSLINERAIDPALKKVALENIESGTGKYLETDSEYEGEGVLFHKDDILFGKLRPYLAKVYQAEFEGQSVGDIYVFRGKEGTNPDFLKYMLISDLFISVVDGSTYGAKMPRANWDFISNLKIAIPCLEEQTKIANYLDYKIGKIDSLISAKERQIEDLQQYRSSVISEAVTRGLHPEVEFRDSGIEWIGKIPFYWDTYKLKYLVNLQSGTNLTAEQIQEDGLYPVYGGNGLRGYYNEFSNDGLFILIGRQGALCGNINYANGKFWATEHAVVCYPKKDFVTKWLGELLRTMNLNQYSESAAQPGLSVERIKQLVIPVPPISEQQEIADYLDNMTSKIDATIQELKTQIEDLRQYKKSVISEAVTGKVDLRDWKPK